MKKEYKFDAKTGTMVPVGEDARIETNPAEKLVTPSASVRMADIVPQSASKRAGGIKSQVTPSQPVIPQPVQIVKLKRSKTLTPVQLVNDQGVPEAYLSPVNTGILMFREGQDYDIYQIADERSKKVLAYIGGYALDMCFNMQELNTMEKIEQCLEGIKKLFRHKIMSQVLPPQDTEQR